ncbi:MAG: universal stress protein [Nitrospira sp.]|nr:universal stress protein [Nitrospira sp.]MDH4369850.1 universal stress protein [Nitrospira sp.]MDH5346424.1 universal stress protein [Nitrospira sp.]MDH5497280.1 universal stress protein [Nitrospira sp.]
MTLSESGPRLLLATDGSQGSAVAEDYAFALAQSWGASLSVMNVLECPPGLDPENPVNQLYLTELMKQATSELVALKARAVDRGISVHTRIATGIPSEEVLSVATGEDPDLIVVGTRGKTGLAHVLLGSTAERIIRGAPCPVLAARAERQGREPVEKSRRDPAGLERILVPVDFSDCSLDALEYAALVAQRSKASLKLLHVLEPISYGLDFTLPHRAKRESIKAGHTKRLSDLVSRLATAGVPSELLIMGGLPTDSILDAARTQPADLIVMGTHGRRGLSHALFGSIAESVLRKSSCPVLMVRSPKFRPGHRRVLSGQSRPTNV